MTGIIRILVGALLLVLGRKLFWIFVGAIGFLVGFALATRFLVDQPDWVILLIALVAGIIGSVLAVFVQRLAVIIAGFLAGGYLTLELLDMVNITTGEFSWLPYILGGIVGALLMAVLFDWALILLSSLAGATLIAQTLPTISTVDQSMITLIFVVLLIVGILIQAAIMRREDVVVEAEATD